MPTGSSITDAQPRPAANTPDGAAAEIMRQQQIHLVKRLPMMAQVNAFNATLTAGVIWLETGSLLVAPWLLLMLALAGLQLANAARFARRGTPKRVSGKSLRTARYWSGFAGVMWGAVALVFPAASDGSALGLFSAVVVAGMTAGTVMLLSPLPTVNLFFSCASLLPLAFAFALKGDLLHATLAALSVMFVLTLHRASTKSYETLRDMVVSSIERDRLRTDLIDAIDSTNDGFALLDDERNVVVANTRFQAWFPDVASVAEDSSRRQMRQTRDGAWVISSLRPTRGGGYVSVHADVTELKEREQELTAEKLRAEAGDRAKTQFLARMSHELRTPLNAIIGFSQVMRDELFGSLGDERYKEFASDISAGGEQLLAIINDILDLSKLEAETYRVDCDDLDVIDAIEWAAASCEQSPENAPGRRVELDLDDDAEFVFVDSRAFKRMLTAVIGNAVKFTPEGKRVGVRTRGREHDVLIEIWDEGVGIPEDRLDDVLKPFVQVANVFVSERHGSGLGLPIAASLAKLMNCVLEIDSVEGEGTTVRLTIPLDEPRAQSDAA